MLSGQVKSVRATESDPFAEFHDERAVKMTITPEQAQKLLSERNIGNRPWSRTRVEFLASQIRKGRWMVTGETMSFGRNGRLLNGQHRLRACVLAGMPITLYVVFGIDPEAFRAMDKVARRTVGDDLAVVGEKHPSTLASIANMIWTSENDPKNMGIKSASSEDAWEVIQQHPEIRDIASFVRQKTKLIPIEDRIAGYCLYEFQKRDYAAARLFFEQLATGANLMDGDPVLLLRNRLLASRESTSRMKNIQVMAITIKAWNFRRSGKTIRVLAWKDAEEFPKII